MLVAVAGAASAGLALAVYARIAWWSVPIGWIGLVPWLLVLDRTRSIGGALGAGVMMSIAFVMAVLPWLPRMIGDYTGTPWPICLLLAPILAPVLEPQFLSFAAARHLARQPGGTGWWLPALVGAGVYVGTEWAWPKVFADTLGHGLYASPRLRQAADLIGAHGLTFATILGNECVLAAFRALRAPRPLAAAGRARGWTAGVLPPAACLVLLAGGLAAYGAARLAQLRDSSAGQPIAVASIQANLAHYDRLRLELGTYETVRRILESHFTLSRKALRRHRLDLLVWPETIYPTTFGTPLTPEGEDFDRAIARFVADAGAPLLFGAYATDGATQFNAALLLQTPAPGRLSGDTYRKTRLFPFTEYLPGPLDSARVRRWLPWAGTWAPGDGPRVLTIGARGAKPTRIAPLICYDALDTDFVVGAVRQGAELLVTLSNDSWFAFPGVQRFILIMAAFRSVETRRPQLRSTPTGVSALIDDTGAVTASLDVGVRGVLSGTLRPATTRTLLLAWGNWLPPAALVGALLLLPAARRRAAREAPPPVERRQRA